MDPYVIARESDNAMCLSFSALFGRILIEGFCCAAYDTGLWGLAICRPRTSYRSSMESRMVLCAEAQVSSQKPRQSDSLGNGRENAVSVGL